jgi:uncharacterized RDD family membrane protein YckC
LHIDGLCPGCNTQNAHSTHLCRNCRFDFATPAAQASPAQQSLADLRSQSQPTPLGTGTPIHGFVPPQFRSSGVDCPRCHHLNKSRAAFCYNCGLPFDGSTGFQDGNSVDGIAAYVGAKPGGFGMRFVALIIDSIVTTAAISLLILVFTDVSASSYLLEPGLSEPTADFINWTLSIAYAPVLLGIWATTVGKRAFNLYVLRLDGAPVGFWRAFGREIAKLLSFIPFGAGFWMVAFRQDRRALHDLIAGTVVVQR